jgi:hypothetical protein
MGEEIPVANEPLSDKERAAASKLTDADLQIIDAAILASSSSHWLKVARVVSSTEDILKNRYPDLSHVFYAQRLIQLSDAGQLESQGNLEYMRFSEVRIPR